MAKPVHKPNGKKATVARWRHDMRIRAAGAIVFYGGTIRGIHLAGLLAVDPRALRGLLIRNDAPFVVEYRESPAGKDEAWYRMKPGAIAPPESLPMLRREATLDGKKAPRIGYRGGPTPAVERFAERPKASP